MPTNDSVEQLLEQHRQGNPTARARLAEQLCQLVQARLSARHPKADEMDVTQATNDAVLELLARPDRFDAAKGSLVGFVFHNARRDLYNIHRSEFRHRRKRTLSGGNVENDDILGNISSNTLSPLDQVIQQEESRILKAHVDRMRQECRNREEEIVFDLMLQGERTTEVFALALGIDHQTEQQQRETVTRIKNRLKKRLSRKGMWE